MSFLVRRGLRALAAGLVFSLFWTAASVLAPDRAEAGAPVITWRLENPFRFFTDPHDTEVHRATFRSLGPAGRTSPVLAAEHALQSRDRDGWAASMYRKTCWNNNRFKCDAYDDYINPSNHAVFVQLTGIEDASALSCRWLTAPRGDAKNPRGDVITQPCSEQARFVVPYPGGMMVTVEIGGREVAKSLIKVRDILVAGMGDSFASGEGNPDRAVRFSRERSADYSTIGLTSGLTGYPARIGPWRDFGDKNFIKENARWLDQACHRSLYSGQLRTALQLAVEDPHRAVTFVGVSCAGAEVTDGLFLRYKGNEWVPNPPRLSQISAVAEAQCGNMPAQPMDLPEAFHQNGKLPQLKDIILRRCPPDEARKIDLVLLSIGGNDIGFSRLLANAVLSNESLLRQLGGWLGQVHGEAEASSELATLGAKYKALNRAIHSVLHVPWQESDRIMLVAYPGLALEGDGSQMCADGNAGMEVVPDFQLDRKKLKLGTWFADKLHRLMRDNASEFGWTFVETHRRAFIGRGICAGLSVAGVGEVDDLRIPRKIDGIWTPYNPADYQPYAARQRWFRTPNDAFMTGNFHVAAGMLTKVLSIEPFAPFQLILASTYSGAFHPTAEGHAAIADAVVDKARAVLAKYGQGPDAEPTGYAVPSPDDVPAPAVPEPGAEIPDINSVLSKLPAGGGDGGVTSALPGKAPGPLNALPDASAPFSGDLDTPSGATVGVTSGSEDRVPSEAVVGPPPVQAVTAPVPSSPAAPQGTPIELRPLNRTAPEPLVDQAQPAPAPRAAPIDDAFTPKPFAPASGSTQ
ncbi:hypothetical protein [Hyphomicrobium sp.]|uniref:hypothetical protein n=1 Tax=Hyphomicrobium sp. TaxID=82 RepID=UPI002D79B804|nr:hypothetical protein [Hyphomicrobium sp.]HET6389117.1 hypothetical protein [Hyphomicrobium sp.]